MVTIQSNQQIIQICSPNYIWEWDLSTDMFFLFDRENRIITRAFHQPLIETTRNSREFVAADRSFVINGDRVEITYQSKSSSSTITVIWLFFTEYISLEPLIYKPSEEQEIIKVVYFPEVKEDSYKPSLYSHYVVVPGLCMSSSISPIIDLHSKLSVTTVLGSGAMSGPGLTQQWGLPVHYFCTFNTSDQWNALGANNIRSDAACWGLIELPQGDFRLETRDLGISPILNLRGDIWKHKIDKVGIHLIIAFGKNYHEAIRKYYQIFKREILFTTTNKNPSEKKKEVLLASQYNTWGVESTFALKPQDLTEDIVLDIYKKFKRSGLKAQTFVIDDKWEGQYGELKHDENRFPNFIKLLNNIREEGFYIGLWAAFLRCQNPFLLGLNESHLLHTSDGKPLWLDHQTARYGIFDVTQTIVQKVLSERAKQFIRTYHPDLIKFDFGYELPSLDVAAPADMNWSGERLLQKGLEVIVGAMKEENPDLVIMYYGLSPLLIDHYDLHSPDDLVYCIGDYDLETNRRVLFSSLCGELGMPTYSSSGYDWASAMDIWFDSAPSGTLGSLLCFDGDENGEMPEDRIIAKFNGLSSILRKKTFFHTYPVGAAWGGGLRAGFSPSWERIEEDKTVLIALRTHRFDGKLAISSYKDIIDTNIMVIVASMTDDGIAEADHLGIVPFENGSCTIRHTGSEISGKLIEHYFGGHRIEKQIRCTKSDFKIDFIQIQDEEILEWVEIRFESNQEG